MFSKSAYACDLLYGDDKGYWKEPVRMGLFTVEDRPDAFLRDGLAARVLEDGLRHRGRYVARRA